MRILLLGSGGREHALAWKLCQSPDVESLIVVSGNPGTSRLAKVRNVSLELCDFHSLISLAHKEHIDLTVVGPEKPLAEGIVDVFSKEGLLIFGPSQKASQLEASKCFAKHVMSRAKIPTATSVFLSSPEQASSFLEKASFPLVLKADGLAAGKGVLVCNDRAAAESFLKQAMSEKMFGDAGSTILAEEFLEGDEVSFLVIAHKTTYVPLVPAQDHKRLLEQDQGPNTGGMGAYSPAPVFTKHLQDETEMTIVRPLLATMDEMGIPFSGVLYVGLMITAQGPKVLECNVRLGDPEAQAILPRLENDLAQLLYCAAKGDLSSCVLKWSEDCAFSVVLASQGYPSAPTLDMPITGLTQVKPDVLVFHAGTKEVNSKLFTSGGRVFSVTALGRTFQEAKAKVYEAAHMIQFEGKIFRKDIGWRLLDKPS